jgi:hypothetical protein
MSDLGKANFEAWQKSGATSPWSEPMEYDELPSFDRRAFDAGADAVEQWLAEALVDEDAPGNKPAAKVIIVRDEAGREHRYNAPNFGMLHDGTLVIGDKTTGEDLRVDAARAPGRWSAVCKDGVLSPDSTATALRIARRALEEISKFVLEADDPRTIVVRIARDALDDVFAETEL